MHDRFHASYHYQLFCHKCHCLRYVEFFIQKNKREDDPVEIAMGYGVSCTSGNKQVWIEYNTRITFLSD